MGVTLSGAMKSDSDWLRIARAISTALDETDLGEWKVELRPLPGDDDAVAGESAEGLAPELHFDDNWPSDVDVDLGQKRMTLGMPFKLGRICAETSERSMEPLSVIGDQDIAEAIDLPLLVVQLIEERLDGSRPPD